MIRDAMTYAIDKANDAYRATRATAVRKVRAWQPDLMSDHQARIYSSPGGTGLRNVAPVPTTQLVRLRDNTEYVVWSDGSFRLRVPFERRPAHLSGRQRRKGRKALRVLLKHPDARNAVLRAHQHNQ